MIHVDAVAGPRTDKISSLADVIEKKLWGNIATIITAKIVLVGKRPFSPIEQLFLFSVAAKV